MSSALSYEAYKKQFSDSKSGITAEGGIYISFINQTGATSIKGTIVTTTTVTNAIRVAPSNAENPIGIIYEDGVANGSLVKVVIAGRADVLLKDATIATSGYWCGVSNVAGRMEQLIAPSTQAEHNREIGHSLENKIAGVNTLSSVILHFN